MRDFPILPAIIVAAIVFIVAFFGFDAGLGNSDGTRASLADKHYVPAWVQVNPITHSDGRVEMQIIHHPEQFFLVFDNGMEVAVNRAVYYNSKAGQRFVLTYRVGKWTGLRYGTSVHPDSKLER